MSDRSRDVRVRLLSEHDDSGFKSAEASAKVMERELNKLEQTERRMANLQMSAAAEQVAREAAKAQAVVDANRRQGEAMTAFGRVALTASAAVAVGLGVAAKAAMDWESAWAGVTKTVDGSPEQMALLETQLRGLAKVLPATHAEIAGVAEAAGQLGVKRQDIAAFTKTMIDLGETTNLSADEAATSLAQFSNIMGTSAGQVSKLGSTLVALGNDGASTEADIMSMGLRIAGAGRTVGLTAPQVLGLASALSSVGIEAEAGGTAISKVMLQIDKDVAGGSKTVAEYARVAGVSAAEFATRWKADAAGTVDLFIQGLGRMQDSGQNTTKVLEDMGFSEVRTSDALRRAALSGDLLTRSLETGSAAFVENIALVDEANKRYGTAASRLEMARNQINDAAIDIGANFLPALASAAEAVGSLAAGFGALPPEVQAWVANLGAAAAGLGLVVGGASIVIPKLKELGTTVNALRGGSSLLGNALGGTASVLAGPWGIALAAATLGIGFWLKSQGDAKKRVDELTASLDEQTGAITEVTRASVAKALRDAGAFEDAAKLGIALDVVTDAALGNAAAQRQVADVMADVTRRRAEAREGGSGDLQAIEEERLASQQLTGALQEQGGFLEDSRSKWSQMKEAMGEGTTATDGAAAATAGLTTEFEDSEKAAKDAADAIDLLAKMLDDMNAPVLNARDAERAWLEQIDAVTASIKENGTTLDLNTDAGRANAEVLDGLAVAGAKRATTLLQETGSEDQFRASLDASRQSLHDQALKFGMTEDAAWAYVDSVLAIPSKADTKAALDAAAAKANAEELARLYAILKLPIGTNIYLAGHAEVYQYLTAIQAKINAINGTRVRVAMGPGGQGGLTLADGAVVTYYGAGGLQEDHTAQIAPAGAWRVWAEPETGGEAYIPLAQPKRARAEAVLEDVASRFGMYVGRYAAGAVLGGGSAPAPVMGGLTINGGVATLDVDEFARKVLQRQQDAVALYNLGALAGGS